MRSIFSGLLLSLAWIIPTKADENAKMLVVAVGGNSECFHHGGTWSLFKTDGRIEAGQLVRALTGATGVRPAAIKAQYFSWTGDAETSPGCFPGHLDWISGGSRHIRTAWPDLEKSGSNQKIVIVGWSNGGATAYELACDLSRARPGSVSLLVTLDAASWSTSPCTNSAGIVAAPARRWIGVFTRSAGWQSLKFSNIVGLFGRAWNDTFPPVAVRARPLYKLEPASHGDVEMMWGECVTKSEAFREWAKVEFGEARLPNTTPDKVCIRM